MREVEIRESQLTKMVGLGWIASLVVTLVIVAFFENLPFTRFSIHFFYMQKTAVFCI